EGGVVNQPTDEGPVAIFAGPAPDGFTMSAFRSACEGRTLTFRREHGWFVDAETDSRWTVEGVARSGPLTGGHLEPLRWFYVRWHAWIYFHRDTRLFLSTAAPIRFQPAAGGEGMEGFGPILARLAAGHDLSIEGPPVSQRRPRESS